MLPIGLSWLHAIVPHALPPYVATDLPIPYVLIYTPLG